MSSCCSSGVYQCRHQHKSRFPGFAYALWALPRRFFSTYLSSCSCHGSWPFWRFFHSGQGKHSVIFQSENVTMSHTTFLFGCRTWMGVMMNYQITALLKQHLGVPLTATIDKEDRRRRRDDNKFPINHIELKCSCFSLHFSSILGIASISLLWYSFVTTVILFILFILSTIYVHSPYYNLILCSVNNKFCLNINFNCIYL